MTGTDASERSESCPLSSIERAEQALDHLDRILAAQTEKLIAAAKVELAERGGKLDS